MSGKKIKALFGRSIEFISPIANVLPFPGVPELFSVIDRIVVLVDTARCNKETLPYIKEYMLEVKQTIDDNKDIINDEDTPSLMKALKNWERFLLKYTRPKMKTLLAIINADQIDRKIGGLFADLDRALNAANLRVNLENNKRLKEISGTVEKVDEHIYNLGNKVDALQINVQDAVKDAVKGAMKDTMNDVTAKVKDSFLTTAVILGARLSKEQIDGLKIEPELVSPDQPHGDGRIKVRYCLGLYAEKIKIAKVDDNIDKYWVQAFISSKLDKELFMKIYGILLDGGFYYMITEWPEKGTLYQYLKEHKNIPWTQKIKWASHLARALAVCHVKHILHHDIRSHNVVVDENDSVKLANYHLARGMEDKTTSVGGVTDSVRWLCPEKVREGTLPYSKSADVYSFGMLMWEISSHDVPFSEKNINEVYASIKNSDERNAPRPPIVPGTPGKYAKIMQRCWRQIPGDRPTMQSVVRKLEKLENVYDSPGYATDDAVSSSVTEYDSCAPTHPSVTIDSAIKLHTRKRFGEAFNQFKILADQAEPSAEANFYVGRYLLDPKIQLNSREDPNVGVSYLEAAEELGCNRAAQFRAQEKMAAAAAIRKRLLAAGDDVNAGIIMDRMKTECLAEFRDSAKRGDLRCMKDLADYGAKLGDEESFKEGRTMLRNVINNSKDDRERAKARDFLTKLQVHNDKFLN
ncbi:10152_t:CDS:2 [Paraglomus occultum]|uniref:10152_t:CDS:1 n=1 Tax=Paraglomus occultum TaxID=144539 RepID=A0A9N9AJ63_9GLOM|nr:10152_t:CDS:2 [Paraglomus occultum]